MPWDGLGRAYALSDKGHGLAVLVEDAVGVVRLAVGVETAQLTRRPRGTGAVAQLVDAHRPEGVEAGTARVDDEGVGGVDHKDVEARHLLAQVTRLPIHFFQESLGGGAVEVVGGLVVGPALAVSDVGGSPRGGIGLQGLLVEAHVVVALHVVLVEVLPVAGPNLVVGVGHDPVLRDPISRERLVEGFDLGGEGCGVVIEVDPDKVVPDLGAKLGQADRVRVEVDALFHVESVLELAVEAVGPAVVGALEPARAATLARLNDQHVAVATHGRKGTDLHVLAAHDYHGLAEELDGEEVAGFAYLSHVPDVDPLFLPDTLNLALEEGLGGVMPGLEGAHALGCPVEVTTEGGEKGVKVGFQGVPHLSYFCCKGLLSATLTQQYYRRNLTKVTPLKVSDKN